MARPPLRLRFHGEALDKAGRITPLEAPDANPDDDHLDVGLGRALGQIDDERPVRLHVCLDAMRAHGVSTPVKYLVQNGEDTEGYRTELRYFRDIEGREVDFVVVGNGKPVLFVECKAADGDVSTSLRYLKGRFPAVDAWQVAAGGTRCYVSREGVRVASALDLLVTLV